jgi:Skp family chaperone for outer membrane proteins
MPLPTGVIGCLTQDQFNEWYNSATAADKFLNTNATPFRAAVAKINTEQMNYLYFKPTSQDEKDYTAPCPVGWTRDPDLSKNICHAPSGYTIPANKNCNEVTQPSGASTPQIASNVDTSKKASIETKCNLAYPSYPKGAFGGSKGTSVPTILKNVLINPDNITGTCPTGNPVSVFAMPSEKIITEKCLDGRTNFMDCFKAPAQTFLTSRITELDTDYNSLNDEIDQFRYMKYAIQKGISVDEAKKEIQAAQATSQTAIDYAKQRDRLLQARDRQEELHKIKQTLYATRYDQKMMSDLITRQTVVNQKELQDSSQNIYLQNYRWKMAKRMQELENEWYDRILLVCKIVVVLLVGGLVAYYYYARGQNSNWGFNL